MRNIAVKWGYDLQEFMAHDARPNNFWQETYDRVYHHWLDHEGIEWKLP